MSRIVPRLTRTPPSRAVRPARGSQRLLGLLGGARRRPAGRRGVLAGALDRVAGGERRAQAERGEQGERVAELAQGRHRTASGCRSGLDRRTGVSPPPTAGAAGGFGHVPDEAPGAGERKAATRAAQPTIMKGMTTREPARPRAVPAPYLPRLDAPPPSAG